jgi:hypothetical protein
MSLTSYLNTNIEFKIRLKLAVKAPPVPRSIVVVRAMGSNNSLLGVAFDYAARFKLQRSFAKSVKIVAPESLEAEQGYKKLSERLGYFPNFSLKSDNGFLTCESGELQRRVDEAYFTAKEAIVDYQADGIDLTCFFRPPESIV